MTNPAPRAQAHSSRSYLTDTSTEHDRLNFYDTAVRVAARLSHPSQQTPLSVAVQGADGSGKTTFMRLMRAALKEQNSACWSVWYEPWRFDTARDAWRGLVYEFTDTVGTPQRRGRTWFASAKGLMERRWSYDLLQAVEDDPGGPEVTRQFRRYLERVAQRLNGAHGPASPLVVVFIDDLDRCTPESAAAVLQASTLLLNSRGFVTVFGLTPGAFNSIGRSAAAGSGTKTRIASPERFFQIALQVPTVSRAQFRAYVDACVDQSACPFDRRWTDVLSWVLFPSPRDVKRFLNYLISEWDKADSARLLPSEASITAGHSTRPGTNDPSVDDATTAASGTTLGTTPPTPSPRAEAAGVLRSSADAAHSQFVLLALLTWRFPEVADYLRGAQADPDAFDRLVRAALRADAEDTGIEVAAPGDAKEGREHGFLADPALRGLMIDSFGTAERGAHRPTLVPPFRSPAELGGLLFHFGGAPSAADPLSGSLGPVNPEWSATTSLQEARDRSATRGDMAAAKWSAELLQRRQSTDAIVSIRAYREQARNNQQMGLQAESHNLANEALAIAAGNKVSAGQRPLAYAEAHLALAEHFAAFSPLSSAIDQAQEAWTFALEAKESNTQLQALIALTYARKLDWQNTQAIADCRQALELDGKTGGLRDVTLRLLLAELHHRQARQHQRECKQAAWRAEIDAALAQSALIDAAIAAAPRDERQRYERLRRRLLDAQRDGLTADPNTPSQPVAFISYAHKNPEPFGRVRTILDAWRVSGKLHVWEDTQIQVGALWQLEIESALEEATHAIMLSSPEYEASEFIRWVERPRINSMFNRGDITLLIIPLGGAVTKSTLSGIQFLWPQPLDSLDEAHRDEAWKGITAKLEAIFNPPPPAGGGVTATAAAGSEVGNAAPVGSTASSAPPPSSDRPSAGG
ncbi:MAG: P-loop NTPase fold protein [bacterium]